MARPRLLLARGAVPVASVTGYGFCTEAYDLTRPDPGGSGVAAAAVAALRMAAPRRVGWVKGYGTGTTANDAAELQALAMVFGAALGGMPVASLKSTLGQCLGGSGAIELAATVEALGGGFVPATLGFEEPDLALPSCPVANTVQEASGDGVLFLSESFGRRCAALIIERI